MAYGYGKTDWKLQAEANAARREAAVSGVQNSAPTRSGPSSDKSGNNLRPPAVQPGENGAQEARYDSAKREVVYPAQLNVKFNGQFVGRGWRKQTKYGPCLTLQLEQDVPAGGKLLIVPRRQFPDCLGSSTQG